MPEPVVNRPTNPSPVGLSRQQQDPHEEKNEAPADGPVVIEDFDEGWLVSEEPVIIYH
jgi:hypothetical protein